MRSYVITLRDNPASVAATEKLLLSSEMVQNDFEPLIFDAVTPEDVNSQMSRYALRWAYPDQGEVVDFLSGLTKRAYQTADPKKRIACFLSHYSLWLMCAAENVPYLILEHDAQFLRQVPTHHLLEEMDRQNLGVLGLNDPRGATRKSQVFYESIVRPAAEVGARKVVMQCPMVDEDVRIPQGLAGNSAYIIRPMFAKKMLQAVDEFGAWPNDALMCKQLFPGKLGVTYPFYTNIQRMESTTTL